jgi:hypothetical protein
MLAGVISEDGPIPHRAALYSNHDLVGGGGLQRVTGVLKSAPDVLEWLRRHGRVAYGIREGVSGQPAKKLELITYENLPEFDMRQTYGGFFPSGEGDVEGRQLKDRLPFTFSQPASLRETDARPHPSVAQPRHPL